MSTLFTSIYKYRESPFRNQKENYVNEILCYILKNDETFSKAFFKYIGLSNWKLQTCSTQNSHNDHGRPDITIEMNDGSVILIECKIDSLQGIDQLNKYSNILKRKDNPKNRLIYLTKYQEPIDIDKNNTFHHIKWQDIFIMLKNSTNNISIEFKTFLIENKMTTDYKFEREEISGIQDYTKTIAKLKDIIDKIKDIAVKHNFEKIKIDKTLSEGNLGLYFKLKKGDFWIGFYQYENHKEIQFGATVELNKQENKDKKISDLLMKLNYEEIETENLHYWTNVKSITYFFKNDLLDVNKVLKFSEDRISEILKIRAKASQ
jgi:hypothetical protein